MSAEFKAVGVDLFVRQAKIPEFRDPSVAGFRLRSISNRGTKIWPAPTPPIHLTDVFGCRFLFEGKGQPDFTGFLTAIEKLGFEWVHVEKLHELGGKPAYSSIQGE